MDISTRFRYSSNTPADIYGDILSALLQGNVEACLRVGRLVSLSSLCTVVSRGGFSSAKASTLAGWKLTGEPVLVTFYVEKLGEVDINIWVCLAGGAHVGVRSGTTHVLD